MLFKKKSFQGFDVDRIYTPQGDFGNLQCAVPCKDDAVWSAAPLLPKLLAAVRHDGSLPESLIPICPHCQGPARANVRGGDWFLASPYREQQKRLRQFLQKQ